jgi:hypothetical protein
MRTKRHVRTLQGKNMGIGKILTLPLDLYMDVVQEHL